jgi:hypothetical protein
MLLILYVYRAHDFMIYWVLDKVLSSHTHMVAQFLSGKGESLEVSGYTENLIVNHGG